MVNPLWTPPRWGVQKVAVIGAGLAGTSTALALAQRGVRCDLFDPEPASGASGNAQGMLYVAPQVDPTVASRFWLQAFDLACQRYQTEPHYHPTGLLTLAETETDAQRLQRIYQALARPPEDLAWVDAEQASAILGLKVQTPGLFWPKSGWMAVRDYVLRPLPGVRRIEQSVTELLEQDDQVWVNGAGYDAAVLCNAYHAKPLLPSYLTPRPVRGQISRIEGPNARTAVCADGYLTPPDASGLSSYGASFVPKDDKTDIRADDDAFNQALMTQLLGAPLDGQPGESRASIRCASPDYLPIVGCLPQANSWVEHLAKLRVDAKWRPEHPATEFSRIAVNLGHGSRGLTSTPLCAEIIASEFCGTPIPADADLAAQLSPARFLIRALKRNQR